MSLASKALPGLAALALLAGACGATPPEREVSTPTPGATATAGAPSARLSREEAVRILLEKVIRPESLDHQVLALALDEPLPAGSEVAAYAPDPLPDGVLTLPHLVPERLEHDTWFFWVDDAPLARFSHPTRYVFIHAVTGEVRVTDQGWWPHVDGRPVEAWMTAERWKADNWVFTNVPEGERPTAGRHPDGGSWLAAALEGLLYRTALPAAAAPAGEAIVPINGWKSGQVEIGTPDDLANVTGFSSEAAIPKYDPQGETLADIEGAVRRAVEAGAKDVLIYFTGHGTRTASGQSVLLFKDTVVTAQDLIDTMGKFPGTRFKVVLDACYSGGLVPALRDSGVVDIALASAAADETAWSDSDRPHDPNPEDRGGEYSSGLWEDLHEVLQSEELQQRAREVAQVRGWDEFVGWLLIAHVTAVQKNATAIDGRTHPVSSLTLPGAPTRIVRLDTLADGVSCQDGGSPAAQIPLPSDIGGVSSSLEGDQLHFTFEFPGALLTEFASSPPPRNIWAAGVGWMGPAGPPPADPDWRYNSVGNAGANVFWYPQEIEFRAFLVQFDPEAGEWTHQPGLPFELGEHAITLIVPQSFVSGDSWYASAVGVGEGAEGPALVCDDAGLDQSGALLPFPEGFLPVTGAGTAFPTPGPGGEPVVELFPPGTYRLAAHAFGGQGECGYAREFDTVLIFSVAEEQTGGAQQLVIEQPDTGDRNTGMITAEGRFRASSERELYDKGVLDPQSLTGSVLNVYTDANGCVSTYQMTLQGQP